MLYPSVSNSSGWIIFFIRRSCSEFDEPYHTINVADQNIDNKRYEWWWRWWWCWWQNRHKVSLFVRLERAHLCSCDGTNTVWLCSSLLLKSSFVISSCICDKLITYWSWEDIWNGCQATIGYANFSWLILITEIKIQVVEVTLWQRSDFDILFTRFVPQSNFVPDL